MLCDHKLGKVEQGYQYCQLCGLGITAECNHNFSSFDTQMWEDDDGCNYVDYIMQCNKCGKLRTYRSSRDKTGYLD